VSRVYFCDFDGTITTRDTCWAMVEAFAADGWQEIDRQWQRKEISTEECANRTFRLFKADLGDLRQLLAGVQIDPHFKEFAALCRERGERIFVLSDGYDFNIKQIFRREGIDLPFFANRLLYQDGFRISCQYVNPDCGTCGTCKRSLMERLAAPGEERVYIGDGYSDTCPARYADLVFAKGTLARYCREEGIPAVSFDHFGQIIEQIRGLP
jgi:2-hydroxy-3-keto-5-methylthiopentenyl-1-phosphate phosphatase